MGYASCLLSLLLHVGVLLLAVYAPWTGGDPRLDLDQPVYEVELVRMPEQKEAVQVPRDAGRETPKQKKAQKQPQAPAKKRPQAKPVPAEPIRVAEKKKPQASKVPEKKREQPAEAPSKPKSKAEAKTPERVMQEAMQDISARAEKETAAEEDELQDVLAQLKQQAVEQGMEPGRLGRSSAAQGTEMVYAALVRERIRSNWRFPDLGQDQDLQATVVLKINKQGEILEHSLEQTSGNAQFDSSVMRAIARTRALQPPPNEDLQTVRIAFHLQEMTSSP